MGTQCNCRTKNPILLVPFLFLAGCLAVVDGAAGENTPAGTATNAVTKPGDLLKEPDGLELRFGYFPSFDKLRLLVLRTPDAFTGWEARLSKPPLKETLRQWEGPLPFPKAGLTLDAPSLDEGSYMLAVTLVARDGQRRELQRTFERKRFPWETRLQRSRSRAPPGAE